MGPGRQSCLPKLSYFAALPHLGLSGTRPVSVSGCRSPRGQEEGAAPAEVTTSGGTLGEGVSEKRGWPFICHRGVQTAAPSPGVFLGLIFLFKKKTN